MGDTKRMHTNPIIKSLSLFPYPHFIIFELCVMFAANKTLTVIEFEKDNDTNSHIDFITTAAVSISSYATIRKDRFTMGYTLYQPLSHTILMLLISMHIN